MGNDGGALSALHSIEFNEGKVAVGSLATTTLDAGLARPLCKHSHTERPIKGCQKNLNCNLFDSHDDGDDGDDPRHAHDERGGGDEERNEAAGEEQEDASLRLLLLPAALIFPSGLTRGNKGVNSGAGKC